MNRRSFLQAILAAHVAPAFVPAGALMKIVVPKLVVPEYKIAIPMLLGMQALAYFDPADRDGPTWAQVQFANGPIFSQITITPENMHRVVHLLDNERNIITAKGDVWGRPFTAKRG